VVVYRWVQKYIQTRPAAGIAAQLPLRPEELIAPIQRRLWNARAEQAFAMEKRCQWPEV